MKKVGRPRKVSNEEYMVYDTMSCVDMVGRYVQRLRLAVWALFMFDVVFTGLFLIMLYGNQYLIK